MSNGFFDDKKRKLLSWLVVFLCASSFSASGAHEEGGHGWASLLELKIPVFNADEFFRTEADSDVWCPNFAALQKAVTTLPNGGYLPIFISPKVASIKRYKKTNSGAIKLSAPLRKIKVKYAIMYMCDVFSLKYKVTGCGVVVWQRGEAEVLECSPVTTLEHSSVDRYAGYYAAMNECAALDRCDDSIVEAYRLLIVCSFYGNPALVKINRCENGKTTLVYKEVERETKEITTLITRTVSKDDFAYMTNLLAHAGFWNLAAETDVQVFDGISTVLEGVSEGKYHRVLGVLKPVSSYKKDVEQRIYK